MPRKRPRTRNRPGFGGIYQRGTTWWATFRVADAGGHKHKVCVSTEVPVELVCRSGEREAKRAELKAQAIAKLEAFRQRVRDGDFHFERAGERPRFRFGKPLVIVPAGGMPTRAEDVTFEHLTRWLLEDYERNGRRTTQETRRRIELYLAPAFGHLRAVEIRKAHVLAYVEQRRTAGAANAQVNRELSILRRMFSIAVDDLEILERRPKIKTLPENNARRGFVEREQLDKIMAHLPAYLRAPIDFAFSTGWRFRSEVLRLTWENVDFASREVRLWAGTTKTGEGRVIALRPHELAILRAQWELHQRGFTDVALVFHNAGDSIVNPYKAWRAACEAAGCPGKLLHDLRRSAVRLLVRSGVSEKVAMERTGHKTRSVFDRYDISSEIDRRDAAEKLERADRRVFGYSMATVEGESTEQAPVTH